MIELDHTPPAHPAAKNPADHVRVLRMWPGGPLRLLSPSKSHGMIGFQSPTLIGFVGAYVCDVCLRSTKGLYRARAGSNGPRRVDLRSMPSSEPGDAVSVIIIGKVWESQLESKLKLTALCLADFANHDGNGVHPSNEYVQWRTGMSGATIRRHMAELRKLGVLVAQENMSGGRGRIPLYRVNVDALPKRKLWRDTRVTRKGAQSDCLLDSERQSSTTGKAVILDHKGSQTTQRNKEDPGGYPGVDPGGCVGEGVSDRDRTSEDQKRARSKERNLEPTPTPRANSKADPPPRGAQQLRHEHNQRVVASAGVRDGIGRALLLAGKQHSHSLDADEVRSWANDLATYSDEQIADAFAVHRKRNKFFPRSEEILGLLKARALAEDRRLREERQAAKLKRERDEWFAHATEAEKAAELAREARILAARRVTLGS